MTEFLTALYRSLSPLWEMSLTAAYAAAIVALLRLLLKKRAPKQVLCLLWLVVFARLLIPLSLESPLSILPDAQQVQFAQELPSKLTGGGQTSSTQGQPPAQNHDPVQNQAPAQAPGNAASVTGDPGVPALTAPDGVSPSAPQQDGQTGFPWQAALAGVWLAVAAAMALYGLASYLRLRRRLFDAIQAKDGVWEHPAVASPFILGVFRPKIYLPAGMHGQPRRFILCHERAHLRRLDHIVKPICWAALVLHWFNPMVWLAFLLMSRDMEAACDEAVLRRLGSEVKADYSETLLSLATNGRLPAPCPLAFDEGDAKGRIKNVLNYRRPALWIVVVSVIAAVLAAVCLLTDPMAAREPEDDPEPEESSSLTMPLGTAKMIPGYEPWMREVLDGERTFRDFYRERNSDDSPDFTIHQLRSFYYGDDQLLDAVVELGKLAVIDLDKDGVYEMVIYPEGDDKYLYSVVGYLVLRREGDQVYGYNPSWRTMGDLKADGTFDWSGSAFNWGTGSMQFTENGFEVQDITWCDNNMDDENYFVDGLAAEQDEFERAIRLRQYQPDPIWYTYADGVLSRALPSIPLDEYTLLAPVPDFLDEEQQLLYRQAYALYSNLFGVTNDSSHFYPGQGVTEPPAEQVERDGIYYSPEYGRFARWDDFERAMLSVFTRDSWEEKNYSIDGRSPSIPIYINVDGWTYYFGYGRSGGDYNGNFPETFRLVEQTDDAISFIMTGYYTNSFELDNETFEEYIARQNGDWEYSIDFPMRMVKTENGWRFDEFHLAFTDDVSPFYSQRVPNPHSSGPGSYINTAAPLSAPLVTSSNDLPADPTQWYKVAELPDDMIWLYAREYGVYSGGQILIRWDGNFYKIFHHTAHTPHCDMPQLKKLGDADHYGPLAVISEVNSGTGVGVYELVVYDLDAAIPMDYTHSWTALAEDFNQNHTFQFDNDTSTMTLTYRGQTVTKTLTYELDGVTYELLGDHDHDRIEQEGCSLYITGEQVYYSFDETSNGNFQLQLGAKFLIGDNWADPLFPINVTWTLRFNGSGFDVVPGSCKIA